MKKFYMIRLENGNSALLQAANEEDAIQSAGLRTSPAQLATELHETDIAATHLAMVSAGVGPQNFTIRELHDFMCIAVLREDGNFEFRLDGETGINEFYLDYPYIDAATEENMEMKPEEASLENPVVQQIFRDAVIRERLSITGAISSDENRINVECWRQIAVHFERCHMDAST